MIDIDANISF